MSANCP